MRKFIVMCIPAFQLRIVQNCAITHNFKEELRALCVITKACNYESTELRRHPSANCKCGENFVAVIGLSGSWNTVLCTVGAQ